MVQVFRDDSRGAAAGGHRDDQGVPETDVGGILECERAGDVDGRAITKSPNRGKTATMTITMDSAGRLVIPKELRKEAELEPGVPLEIRCRDGLIEISPMVMEVTLEREGPFLVARPKQPVPTLTNAVVNRTIAKIRRDRGR